MNYNLIMFTTLSITRYNHIGQFRIYLTAGLHVVTLQQVADCTKTVSGDFYNSNDIDPYYKARGRMISETRSTLPPVQLP